MSGKPQPRRKSTYPKGNWGACIYYGLGQQNGAPAIKIGLSINPRGRAHLLGLEILAWHPGTTETETKLTYRFVDESLGHEWYRPSVRLLCHIATVRDGSPLPNRPAPRQATDAELEVSPGVWIRW